MRAIKAAKKAGLEIARVEIDPKTAKITVVANDGKKEPEVNPFDTAPVPMPLPPRKRKLKNVL
jgi:hypothetical protein